MSNVKVKMKTNENGPEGVFLIGCIRVMPYEKAQMYISGGYAVLVEDIKPKQEAKPKEEEKKDEEKPEAEKKEEKKKGKK